VYRHRRPPLIRTDLIAEAIRLARMLHGLLPADAEISGLLALMLLTEARRAARTDPHQALYLWLERLQPTAPVRLSRTVAVAHAFGARRGLALLEQLDRDHHITDDPLVAQRTTPPPAPHTPARTRGALIGRSRPVNFVAGMSRPA
jgi:predicted RNA polymerase sigma factor